MKQIKGFKKVHRMYRIRKQLTTFLDLITFLRSEGIDHPYLMDHADKLYERAHIIEIQVKNDRKND